jgi:formylglycine-generating enzyme required for sulfatase activity
MKARTRLLGFLLVLIAGIFDLAKSQVPYISSFSNNGLLVCTNLSPGSMAAVYLSSSSLGPWYTMKGLNSITVGSNETIQVNLPVSNQGTEFFRVLGVAAINPFNGMAFIPAGSFTMGGDSIPDAISTNVYVSAFYMDTNLVAYSQWQLIYAFATNNGYSFDDSGAGKAANHPVLTVSWYDVVKWCNARSQQTGLNPVYYTDPELTQIYTNGDVAPYINWTNSGYRLPTEAEWEKAARGGLVGQRFPWGNTISESQANYTANTNLFSYDLGPYNGYNTNFDFDAQPYTSPVGYFPANGYGLTDMAGNIQEWCWDWYGTPYGLPTTNNPTGPGSGSNRILRGGCWSFIAYIARTADRGQNSPLYADDTVGFRCVKGP